MTYDFYIDEKVTIWRRNNYRIVRKSLEKARQIALLEFDSPSYEEDNGFIDSEFIYESEEDMEVGDNNGQSTKGLFFEGEQIKTNI